MYRVYQPLNKQMKHNYFSFPKVHIKSQTKKKKYYVF